MSESYIHQLIPSSPTFRPTSEGVAQFVQGLIDRGNLPEEVTIRVGRIERYPGSKREGINPFTGELMTIRARRSDR